METKHTPGPWRVVIDDDGNPLSGRPGVFAPDELDCAIVHWDGFVQTYWRSARGDKEIHANAHLIAAAPELLEAARALIMYDSDNFAGTEFMHKYDEAVKLARAALRKATPPTIERSE